MLTVQNSLAPNLTNMRSLIRVLGTAIERGVRRQHGFLSRIDGHYRVKFDRTFIIRRQRRNTAKFKTAYVFHLLFAPATGEPAEVLDTITIYDIKNIQAVAGHLAKRREYPARPLLCSI